MITFCRSPTNMLTGIPSQWTAWVSIFDPMYKYYDVSYLRKLIHRLCPTATPLIYIGPTFQSMWVHTHKACSNVYCCTEMQEVRRGTYQRRKFSESLQVMIENYILLQFDSFYNNNLDAEKTISKDPLRYTASFLVTQLNVALRNFCAAYM